MIKTGDVKKVSYSRVSKYLKCPYLHYLSYTKRIQPKMKSKSLQFGSNFHTLLEHRGDSKEELKKLFKAMKGVYEDQPDEFKELLGESYISNLKSIFLDYQKVWKNEALPDKTEFEFNIEIGQSLDGDLIVFNGFIDGLYFDKSGSANEETLIEEHKIFAQKPDMTTLTLSTQKHLYAKAVEELTGYMPKYIVWDYIKNSPAVEPKLLKSGKLSEAQSKSITPYSWKRACKKLGITDKDYINKGKELYKDNINNYFFRVVQEINPEFVEQTYSNFKSVVSDIIMKGSVNRTKNCTKDCSWCEMNPICMAEATGNDLNKILEDNFIQRS